MDGGWSKWGDCSKICGTGTQTRTCDNPEPKHDGAACLGDATQDCNTDPCPGKLNE